MVGSCDTGWWMRLKRMDCCLFAGDTVARIAADNRRRPSDKGQKRKKKRQKSRFIYIPQQIIIRLSPIPFFKPFLLLWYSTLAPWSNKCAHKLEETHKTQKNPITNDTYIFCELCSQVQRSRASAYPLLLPSSIRHVLLTNLRLLANWDFCHWMLSASSLTHNCV